MKKIKKIIVISLIICLALAFGACGKDTSSSVAPAPESTPPVSETASQPETSDVSQPAAGDGQDVAALATVLVEAADIGKQIDLIELDLSAGGIPMDSVESFVGCTSQNYSDNGGLVLVLKAQPGKAEEVKAGVESFKTSRMDDRYAEFATQVENTGNARIVENGDYVVMAVSATGKDGWDKLDAVLGTLFST